MVEVEAEGGGMHGSREGCQFGRRRACGKLSSPPKQVRGHAIARQLLSSDSLSRPGGDSCMVMSPCAKLIDSEREGSSGGGEEEKGRGWAGGLQAKKARFPHSPSIARSDSSQRAALLSGGKDLGTAVAGSSCVLGGESIIRQW